MVVLLLLCVKEISIQDYVALITSDADTKKVLNDNRTGRASILIASNGLEYLSYTVDIFLANIWLKIISFILNFGAQVILPVNLREHSLINLRILIAFQQTRRFGKRCF